MKYSIEVKLSDSVYRLITDTEPEIAKTIAADVNRRIQETRESNPSLNLTVAERLTLMKLADNLYKLQEDYNALENAKVDFENQYRLTQAENQELQTKLEQAESVAAASMKNVEEKLSQLQKKYDLLQEKILPLEDQIETLTLERDMEAKNGQQLEKQLTALKNNLESITEQLKTERKDPAESLVQEFKQSAKPNVRQVKIKTDPRRPQQQKMQEDL